MMASDDITISVLREIRDEMRGMRGEQVETNRRLGVVEDRLALMDDRLDLGNKRMGAVETALLDLAQQQRFVVRYTKTIAERDSRLDSRVTDLEHRVEKLETK